MKVEELHDRASWAEFTTSHGGGILQSFELGELHTVVENPCLYLVVRDELGIRLAALVLRKSLKFGYCYYYCPAGPIIRGGDWGDAGNQQALAALNVYLKRRSRRDRSVYAKIEPHVPAGPVMAGAFRTLGFRPALVSLQAEHVAHVDISGPLEKTWENFKKDARYSARYAERQGVEVIRGRGPRELAMFTKLYHATATNKDFSYRDKAYLEQFRRHLMEDCVMADVYVALHENDPIAASIVTYYGKEAVYLYAGSSKKNQTLYGTYLLQWAAIKEATRRGCAVYNMTGVAATADPEDRWAGLRRFKLKFGAEVVHLAGAYDAPYKPLLYGALNLGTLQRKVRRGSAQSS